MRCRVGRSGPRRLRRKQRRRRLVGVVDAPEVRRKRAADPTGVLRAIGEVDPRVAALHGQREHRPVDPGSGTRAGVELRREDLIERRLCGSCVAPPHARVERGSIDDVEVERVEPDVGDAERQGAGVRLRSVPDLGERLATVGRLVEAWLIGARLEPRRAAVADHVRKPANSQRRPHEDVIRVARVDDNRSDAAAKEGIVARHRARIGGVADALAVELRPVLAVVGRLVDAHAGLASGRAAVGLTCAQIERTSCLVGRIERQRPDRGLIKVARMELLPVWIARQRVVRPPDAAPGDANPDAAAPSVAVGRNHQRSYPARGRVRGP